MRTNNLINYNIKIKYRIKLHFNFSLKINISVNGPSQYLNTAFFSL